MTAVTNEVAPWRRNLHAVWLSQFTAKIGSSFVNPFIAIYLSTELGIRGGALALWAGVVAGASGVGTAVAGPLWGVLADRHGRKSMLLRALLGGALSLALMALTRSAWQLVILRFTQGATGGTSSAATALVAAGTPRTHVAGALGTLSSAATLASAAAPVLGGIGAATIGLRYGFAISGGLVLLSAVPIVFLVKDSRPADRDRSAVRWRLAFTPPVIVVLACQFLLNFGYFSTQQLVVVRLLAALPAKPASFAVGVGFTAAAIASTISAVGYPRLTARHGYRLLAGIAAVGLGTGAAICGLAPTASGILLGLVAVGLAYGGLSPLLAAMLGLAVADKVQATVFGFSASSLALGLAIGPPVSGALAAATTPTVALIIAALSLALSGVLITASR